MLTFECSCGNLTELADNRMGQKYSCPKCGKVTLLTIDVFSDRKAKKPKQAKLETWKGPKQKVGLEKPCIKCGSDIRYGYQGPIEGLCGKCVDSVRRAIREEMAARGAGSDQAARRRGFLKGLAVGFLLTLLACATAFVVLAPTLRDLIPREGFLPF